MIEYFNDIVCLNDGGQTSTVPVSLTQESSPDPYPDTPTVQADTQGNVVHDSVSLPTMKLDVGEKPVLHVWTLRQEQMNQIAEQVMMKFSPSNPDVENGINNLMNFKLENVSRESQDKSNLQLFYSKFELVRP
jgi:hypothetical protein